MLELGDRTLAAHREAGRRAAVAATRLIAVGAQAALSPAAAVAAGMPAAAVAQAEDAERAGGRSPSPCLGPGTVVLVKGSRGIGLDAVVERLLRVTRVTVIAAACFVAGVCLYPILLTS